MRDSDDSLAAGARLRAEIEAHFRAGGPRSLRQLAERAGVQPTTMSQWWTRGAAPDTATLNRVAKALDVPLARLLDAYDGRLAEPQPEAPISAELLDAIEERVRRANQPLLEAIERLSESLAAALEPAPRGPVVSRPSQEELDDLEAGVAQVVERLAIEQPHLLAGLLRSTEPPPASPPPNDTAPARPSGTRRP